MCTINEIDHSVFRQTALLKRLTGLDLINMEIKYKAPFDAKNFAKLIIATNTLPPTTDKSPGFCRRWLIIDFPNQFKEGKDPVLGIPDYEIDYPTKKGKDCIRQFPPIRTFQKFVFVE